MDGDSTPSAPPMPRYMTDMNTSAVPSTSTSVANVKKEIVRWTGFRIIKRREQTPCWICLESDNTLIRACICRNISAHPECLKRWMETSRNPEEKTQCRFCKEPYHLRGYDDPFNVVMVTYGSKIYEIPIPFEPETAFEEFCKDIRRIIKVEPSEVKRLRIKASDTMKRDHQVVMCINNINAGFQSL